MTNKEFNVFGDKKLLENCKINVFKTDDMGNTKKKSLLINGKINKVLTVDSPVIYTIYLSYNDSLFASIEYENILKGDSDEIHNFYIEQKKEVVGVKFIGRKSDLKEFSGTVTLFTTLADYFEKQGVTDDSEKKQIKDYFNNSYN